MRILIEARAINAQGGGVYSYVYELISQFSQIAKAGTNHEFFVVYDDVPKVTFENLQELVVKRYGALGFPLWLHWSMPRAVAETKVDLAHFTKADIPYHIKVPTVVTIYDAIPVLFPDSQRLLPRFYWPGALRRASKKTNHIITISETSKNDLIRLYDLDPERITVTKLGINHNYWRPAESNALERVRHTYEIAGPYILFVSTIGLRKNVAGLVRAFDQISQQIPHTLVIAGRPGKGSGNLTDALNKNNRERVKILDFVEQRDLPALYSGATVFVWPSIYEGWGFPPLEAMACGTPVIVSDGGSLKEVVGDGGLVVPFAEDKIEKRLRDNDFEQRLSQAMLEVITNSDKRRELKESGFKHVNEFQWSKTARDTLAVYDKIAKI